MAISHGAGNHPIVPSWPSGATAHLLSLRRVAVTLKGYALRAGALGAGVLVEFMIMTVPWLAHT